MRIPVLLCAVMASCVVHAEEWAIEPLVPGSPFHGVHGMDFDADGILYAADILGMSVHKVDIATGATEVVVGPPYGAADDVKVGPDGTVVWTHIASGILYARDPDGTVRELASGLPTINTVGFHPDGRLFATQPGVRDALYEVDITGETPLRTVLQPSGSLNGFVIQEDGYLYGPQGALGNVIRVNLDTGDYDILAEGFHDPTGVKSDSQGTLYVNELGTGRLYKLDTDTGERELVVQLTPGNDNITVSDEDLIYVSNFAYSSVQEVNPKTGTVRDVVRGSLSVPGGLAIHHDGEKEWIFVAGLFAARRINAATGEAEIIAQADDLSTFAYPSSVTVNENHIVFSSWFTNRVVVLDLETLEPVANFGGLTMPFDVLEQDDGTFLVAETGANRLALFSEDGTLMRVVAEEMAAPTGLAQKDGDTVYVTEAAEGVVSAVSIATGERMVIDGRLMQPEGIALDADGNILVVDARARSLVRIDTQSGRKEILLRDLPLGLQGPPPRHPTWVHNDVVVGEDGTIYLNSDTETALYKVIRR